MRFSCDDLHIASSPQKIYVYWPDDFLCNRLRPRSAKNSDWKRNSTFHFVKLLEIKQQCNTNQNNDKSFPL